MPLKPWREVITPHEDVRTGALHASTFAADLTQVVRGTAPEEYANARRFFERTLVTEGMGRLLTSVVKRLSGQGGDPVLQLQTAFGGGKTHTLIAVYHAVSGAAAASELPGLSRVLDDAGVLTLPQGRVAVLDGVALGPAQPRTEGEVTRHTLWGELAYQLGGAAGYALVEASDKAGTSPGKDALVDLLTRFGPCVVLVDEATRYLGQFKPGQTLPGGTFDSNVSFVQALTEAVAAVPNAMLLASLPESETEVGDVDGHRAFEALKRFFGRIEAVWKPVEQAEAYEIVRRRLFGDVRDAAARDATVNAFADLYAQHPDAFPDETRTAAYRQALHATYPIHPEVFARLYEDWSTLPTFQRTRGVLRLMAHLVQKLWDEGNADPLILPGSFALDAYAVRSELVQHLEGAGWDAVVERDVDGPASGPQRLDAENPAFGQLQAARRAARTVFLGSAPSMAAQRVRGLTPDSIRLGCTQPGQSPAVYTDAVRALSDRLHYLYTAGERGAAGERYWYDLRPNLRRTMEERLARLADADVRRLVEAEVERLHLRGSLFGGVHVFRATGDVPDDDVLRLVVLPPEATHRSRHLQSKAVAAAARFLKERGSQPRLRPHRLVFLAPDEDHVLALKQHARALLAWTGIVQDYVPLNLDAFNLKQAKEQEAQAKKTLAKALLETYVWALAPTQSAAAAGSMGLDWDDVRLATGGIASPAQALEHALAEKEMVVAVWAPAMLRRTLDAYYFAQGSEVGTKALWDALSAYAYLPRLQSKAVLVRTVEKGTEFTDFFALASARKTDGGYEGLRFGTSGTPYFADGEILVRADAAQASLAPVAAPLDAPPDVGAPPYDPTPPPPQVGDGGAAATPTPTPPTAPRHTGFVGTVAIDPNKAKTQLPLIVEEMVQHYAAQYGAKVNVTLEVHVETPKGISDTEWKALKGNAEQLGFSLFEPT